MNRKLLCSMKVRLPAGGRGPESMYRLSHGGYFGSYGPRSPVLPLADTRRQTNQIVTCVARDL